MPIVSFDASGLEWRVCVHEAQDEVGIAEILSGADFHEDNRVRLGLPTRKVSKTFAFRFGFGGTGEGYARDPDFMPVSKSPKYWDAVIDGMYSKYRGIRTFHTKLAQDGMANGQLVSPSGRIYKYTPRKRYGEMVWPITKMYNHVVQGHAHEIMGIIRNKFFESMMKEPIDALYINSVYDSIIIDSAPHEVDRVIKYAKEAFSSCQEEYKKLFGIPLLVPMECDVSIGSNWGNMIESKA